MLAIYITSFICQYPTIILPVANKLPSLSEIRNRYNPFPIPFRAKTKESPRLRSYYELEEWEVLLSFLNSFSIYLKPHKELGYHQITNLNLIKYTRKMVNQHLGKGNFDRQYLAQEAAKEGAAAELSWLLEKFGNDNNVWNNETFFL